MLLAKVAMVTDPILQWQDLLEARYLVDRKMVILDVFGRQIMSHEPLHTCDYPSKTKLEEPRGQPPVRD
ncbi:Hypp1776 [Branchiostoma lanceolatum]|uniref:Hypp1776 protein n=1 Tax=Branchiostoma lanceolatum TaxID=7740 RepID=A0A8J9ZNE6_BRALA|nr:Hypp1776 [Branchiostoma lanceolatum]